MYGLYLHFAGDHTLVVDVWLFLLAHQELLAVSTPTQIDHYFKRGWLGLVRLLFAVCYLLLLRFKRLEFLCIPNVSEEARNNPTNSWS